MIEARRVQVPAVQMTLTPSEALSLEHMLGMFILSNEKGEYGSGTSIEDDTKLARAIQDALHQARPAGLR